MENIRQTSTENARIREMLDKYLASRSILKSSAAETSAHLDEDVISAFAEGTLAQRENTPVVGHLAACGFCRHRTAELVRLDFELAEAGESVITAAPSVEPSRISAVLSEIFSKIFGTTEGAVFAHEEKDEKDKDTDDKSK